MDSLISGIVPVYNAEHFLHRCVGSILNQDLSDLELILVDDGSSDSSGEICEGYTLVDKRIKVIHQENAGVSKARNAGLSIACGNYITFVDSDDYLPSRSDIYRNAISILEHNEVDILVWLWQFQDKNGNLVIDPQKIPEFFCGKQSTHEFARGLYYGSYANGLVVAAWNKLYKKDFIDNMSFEGQLYEDEDWMTRLLIKEGTVFCQSDFWYVYAQNNSSLTHLQFGKRHLGMLDIVKNRARLFEKDAFIRSKSIKLYLDLYIEYWYRAEECGIEPYEDLETYKKILSELSQSDNIRLKDKFRYMIFEFAPKLYKVFILKMRKKKP